MRLLFKEITVLTLLLIAAGPVFPNGVQEDALDYTAIMKNLRFRSIGPANMGGRVVDLAVVESNTALIYAAVGPSGVWKSDNNGMNWKPVFTKERTVAVGAVAVSQSNPDIVWAGTGEGTSRNSVGIGDGVYKSENGGLTWKNMGLEHTRHIDRIMIDPKDPDTVYVGALGHLWGPNEERGLFKTKDGGKTWEKVLYIDENTGISDFKLDPSNNKILYAGAWDYRRKPFYFRSGGKGSGLFKSSDGGETWKKLDQGLPEGFFGRIGLDISRSNPNVVYALIENANGGLFRSDDKGETWKRCSDRSTYNRINFRPFYYSKLTVDPNNDLVVYVYSGSTYVSRDAGKTFETISQGTHPDHHTLWVNPHNSNHIIDGNDGGIDISFDGGKSWYDLKTDAWSEVYQVGFDLRDPYYIYVGLQDNGSWGGPSNSLDQNGILNLHWYPVGGGDGFYAQIDPRDYRIVYRNAHMGGIGRYNIETGDNQTVKPVAALSEPPYRFNWNAPILISPHDPDILYFGGNFLFKSQDKGMSWKKISPDLSGNDPEKQKESGGPITYDNTGAEIHCTIYTISESPVQAGLIWVGTDDGLVQMTRDGGKSWTDVTKNIKGLPAESWVTRIEASHFAAGTVYACFDRHRWDDYRPYVYKSNDFGQTWISLGSRLPEFGYLHVIREDPVNPDLLYAGSEFGLFLSFNGGREWIECRNGLHTIAVRDIQVHPREQDLIIGTHGHGVWVMDDIRPLQQLTAENLKKDVHLFDLRPATLFSTKSAEELYGRPVFQGENPQAGALIHYFLKSKISAGSLKLSIKDDQGRIIRSLTAPGGAGINRVVWDLRGQGIEGESSQSSGRGRFRRAPRNAYVLPGLYTVVLEYMESKLETKLEVRAYEKQGITLEERKLNQRYVQEIGRLAAQGNRLMTTANSLAEQLDSLEACLKEEKLTSSQAYELMTDAKAKVEKIRTVWTYSVEGRTGYRRPVMIALRGGTLPEQLSSVLRQVSGYPGAPTQTMIDWYKDIKENMEPLFALAGELRESDIPTLNRALNELNFPIIKK